VSVLQYLDGYSFKKHLLQRLPSLCLHKLWLQGLRQDDGLSLSRVRFSKTGLSDIHRAEKEAEENRGEHFAGHSVWSIQIRLDKALPQLRHFNREERRMSSYVLLQVSLPLLLGL